MNSIKRTALLGAVLAGYCQQAEAAGSVGGNIGTINTDAGEDISNMTLLDLDNIGDIDFGGIEDAPGFVTPPNGIYILHVDKAVVESYRTKGDENKPSENKKRFAHYYSIVSVLELEDPTEQKPNVGDKFSERFMINDKGLTYWKSKAVDILGGKDKVGSAKVAQVLLELSNGSYQFKARVQNKKSPQKDASGNPVKGGKEYTNTQVRVMQTMNGDQLDKAVSKANPTEADI